jgi:hypothetical protein
MKSAGSWYTPPAFAGGVEAIISIPREQRLIKSSLIVFT